MEGKKKVTKKRTKKESTVLTDKQAFEKGCYLAKHIGKKVTVCGVRGELVTVLVMPTPIIFVHPDVGALKMPEPYGIDTASLQEGEEEKGSMLTAEYAKICDSIGSEVKTPEGKGKLFGVSLRGIPIFYVSLETGKNIALEAQHIKL